MEFTSNGARRKPQGLVGDGRAAERSQDAANPNQAHPEILRNSLLRERREPPSEPKAGRSRQRRQHRQRSGVKCHPATFGALGGWFCGAKVSGLDVRPERPRGGGQEGRLLARHTKGPWLGGELVTVL